MLTHPHTPPALKTGVTKRMALGLPLVAALFISVTNPSMVFAEVAVQMKCEVTVTVADAGGATTATWKAVPASATPPTAAARVRTRNNDPVQVMPTPSLVKRRIAESRLTPPGRSRP